MAVMLSVAVFVSFGAIFVFVNLLAGSLARPKAPSAEKAAPYECGERSIGSNWVQFDLPSTLSRWSSLFLTSRWRLLSVGGRLRLGRAACGADRLDRL